MEKVFLSPLNVNNLPLKALNGLLKSTYDAAIPVRTQLGEMCNAVLTEFEVDFSNLNGNINKAQKSELTEQLIADDKVIDGKFYEFRRTITYFFKSTNAEKKAAATTAKIFLTPYWDMADEAMITQTADMADMITKCKAKPAVMSALVTLGIDADLTELETLNNAFYAKFQSRRSEHDTTVKPGSSFKSAAIKSYMDFCKAVEQAVNYTPTDIIRSLFNGMDADRIKYHSMLGSVPKDAPATAPKA